MADDLDSELDSALGKETQPASPAPREITWDERLIANSLLNSQPAKRAAFLKQRGFELDPKDDNRFRAVGTKGAYVGKVDPGYHEMYKKDGGFGIVKELGHDVGGFALDHGLNMLATGAGVVEGGAEGAALGSVVPGLGTGIGAAIGGIAGGVASGAISNATAEAIKAGIAKVILNENIPHDYQATAIQSVIAGALPVITSGVGKGIQKLVGTKVNQVADGIVNAANKFGKGNLSKEIIVRAAENPSMYDPAVAKQAGRLANEGFKDIFGHLPADAEDVNKIIVKNRSKDIASDSLIGKALAPLNEQANKAESELAQNPAANFTVRDVLGSFQRVKGSAENTGVAGQFSDKSFTHDITDAALKKVDNYQSKVMKMAESNLREQGVSGPISHAQILDAPLDFSQVRQINKAIKDQAAKSQLPEDKLLMQVVGSGDGQLGSLMNQKAESLGSNFPQIQKARGELIEMSNVGQKLLHPENLSTAYLGDQTSPTKTNVQDFLGLLGNKTGVDLNGAAKDLSAQRAIGQFYQDSKIYENSAPLKYRALDAVQNVVSGHPLEALKSIKGDALLDKNKGQTLMDLYSKKLAQAQASAQSIASRPNAVFTNQIGDRLGGYVGSGTIGAVGSGLYQPNVTPQSMSQQQQTSEYDDLDRHLDEALK